MRKQLLVNIPVALHAKLKFRARQEGRSMTAIVKEAIEDRLGLPYEPSVQEQLADDLEALLESA